MMRRVLIGVAILVAIVMAIWWFHLRPQEISVTVYFVGTADDSGTLVPAGRRVRGRGVETRLRGAIEALLAGPTAEERARGMATEIPAGVRLRSLGVRDGTAIIDLTDTIVAGGGSSSMQGRVWQIVYTGTQLGVRQVRILINGAERQALGGEGVLIDRPIGRPPAFPRF